MSYYTIGRGVVQYACDSIVTLLAVIASVVVGLLNPLWNKRVSKERMPVKGQKYCILVTGASSGIGRSLVIEFAKKYSASKGYVITYCLIGINLKRLMNVQSELVNLGVSQARIHYDTIDVSDTQAMRSLILKKEEECDGINFIIANAGVSEFGLKQRSPDSSFEAMQHQIFGINLTGVINTVAPIVNQLVLPLTSQSPSHLVTPSTIDLPFKVMKSYRAGQPLNICIVSSSAAELSMYGAYATSKRAVYDYARYLRYQLYPNSDVNVSVVIPGWIKTAMTDAYTGRRDMGDGADPEELAEHVFSGVESEDPFIIFPRSKYMIVRGINSLPPDLLDSLLFREKPM